MTERHLVLARALENVGFDRLFGVMGIGNLRVVTDLIAGGRVAYVAARHEAGAVGMADGYSRASGKVGAATVTHGPGLTNAVTALTTAVRYRTPMLVIAGSVPEGATGASQYIDQRAVVEPTGAGFVEFGAHDDWSGLVEHAVAAARMEGRPYVLNVPVDLQERGHPSTSQRPRRPTLAAVHPDPDPAEVAAALEVLCASRHPVILAGRGALDARDQLIELADRCGAVLATTLLAKDLFVDHPYSVGIAGGFSSGLTRRLLAEADVIVAFGASLNAWTTKRGTLFPQAKVIHVDVSSEVQTSLDVECHLHGDARASAETLLSHLPDSTGWRSPEFAEQLAAYKAVDDHADTSRPNRLDPRRVAAALDEFLPKQRILALDGGHYVGFPALHMEVPEPSALIFTLNFGSIGMGLGSAIGAAVGRTDLLCVAVLGDGGLLMSIADLETAVRMAIPMVIVVFDDGAYGAEVHHLLHEGLPGSSATFVNPSFVGLAQGFGAKGVRIDTIDGFAQLEGLVTDLDGPLVVEVPIDGDVLAPWYAEVLASH